MSTADDQEKKTVDLEKAKKWLVDFMNPVVVDFGPLERTYPTLESLGSYKPDPDEDKIAPIKEFVYNVADTFHSFSAFDAYGFVNNQMMGYSSKYNFLRTLKMFMLALLEIDHPEFVRAQNAMRRVMETCKMSDAQFFMVGTNMYVCEMLGEIAGVDSPVPGQIIIDDHVLEMDYYGGDIPEGVKDWIHQATDDELEEIAKEMDGAFKNEHGAFIEACRAASAELYDVHKKVAEFLDKREFERKSEEAEKEEEKNGTAKRARTDA